MRYDTITFLSDYGASGESVGVCKSVIRNICPTTTILDLTHDVPPFDVRSASLTLVRSTHYLCPGVVLGVVDPGTGTERRGLAVELNHGESVLVGPDNGLFAPCTALVGGPTRVFELRNQQYMLDAPNRMRSGRDLFAPVAAHLANGVPITEVGIEIDPATLVPGLVPFSGEKDGVLHADVIWIDRFGNAELNVTADQISNFGATLEVAGASGVVRCRRVGSYDELSHNELGVIVDSHGLVALVAGHGSAALVHQFDVGDAIRIKAGMSVRGL